MSFFDQQVNLSQVEDKSGEFAPITEGEYTLEATSYAEKVSSNNNDMLEIEYTIVGPNFSGRKIWETFVKGQPVAYGRLKGWIVATGFSGDQDLNLPLINSAMNRRFQGNVYMEKDEKKQFPDKPKIRSFLKPQAAPVQQQVQPVQQEQAQFQQPPVQQAPVQQQPMQQPAQQQPVQQPEQQPAGAAQFNAQWSK